MMKKTKILYVEDEPFLGRIVKESLESRNFDVVMIDDGNLALHAFDQHSPDLCVLDIMLPHVDGYTLAREIKKRKQSIPIIFVTAKTQIDDVVQGFESGGNDYIRKPFSLEELIIRINNLLTITQQQTSSQESITLGQYEFMPLRFELKRGDRIKKLSYREVTLLQMLVEKPNATVLRKDILMKLWGDDSFFNSRNLDVYITKLRDHFKEDANVEIITIKGIGYRFAVS